MSYVFKETHFTVEDIAKARSISGQAVRKALKQKRLLGVKIAGAWFIPKSVLEERGWMKSSLKKAQ